MGIEIISQATDECKLNLWDSVEWDKFGMKKILEKKSVRPMKIVDIFGNI